MAVMTSQYTEGVALEQKTQPVPSSDKMALDLDINGLPARDETNIDPASEFNLKSNDLSTPENVEPDDLEVNGADNLNAFDSNRLIANEPINCSIELQAIEISPTSAPNSSQLLNTNTTTSEAPLTTSPEEPQAETSDLVGAESAIDTVQDSAPAFTIPPVIEAEGSDLRDANSSSMRAESAPVISQDSPKPKVENESLHAITSEEEQTAAAEPSPNNLPIPTPTESVMENPAANYDRESMQIDSELREQVVDSGLDLNDIAMADVAETPSNKIAREREDDDENEPSAKRTKTDDSDTQPLNGEMSSSIVNGEQPHSGPISQHEVKEIVKILKNASRTQNGKNFRAPVAELWPTFAEPYSQRIKDPIDLATIEKKLKGGDYQNMEAFKADLHLLYANALTFNGEEHTVTLAAKEVRDSLLVKVDNLPAEPAPAVKKDKKVKRPTPVADAVPRTSAPRRQSKGSHPAPTPSVAAPPQTFALDPATSMPLIRRDSTKVDGGRPKREIHPPKNKDLIYSVRPKNKKFATELKFCDEVLTELLKPKYHQFSSPFLTPVDPVALGIPNYFAVIKKPMDLSTVSKKLKEGAYSHTSDFEKDVRQMLKNCFAFNPHGNPVRIMGEQLQDLFNSQWARKDQWILDHTPAAASPASAPESEDDEEEEDDDDEAAENADKSTVAIAKERLLEEQKKLITLMTAKHRDPALIQMQQDLVEIVTKRVQTEEENAKKKPKKAKASKPAPKKLAPAKRSNPPAPKKANKPPKTMGTLEKETISAGLFCLPDEVTNTVLEMIQTDQPEIAPGDDGSIELDIDQISTPILWKIYDLIMRHAPQIHEGLVKGLKDEPSIREAAKPAPKKKNKPMTKSEQERKLEHIGKQMEEFKKAGSQSQEPAMPTVEQNDESSGDEDSDSEEE